MQAYQSVPSRLAGLLLALGAAVGTGCGEGPRQPAAGPGGAAAGLQAAPWIAGGRRVALRGARPAAALTLPIPIGAKRVELNVVALREGGWPWPRSASAFVRAGEARVRAQLPVREPDRASWTRLALDLPEGATELELRAEPGGAERIWWSRPRFEGLAPPGARNLLLVSLDTVRADAVGHLGQVHDTTPRLDELAARGTTWTQAVAPSSWTLPSHVSVMTGHYPSWHGRTEFTRREGAELPTLAGLLAGAGWDTAAFTGQGFISFAYGTTQDFDLVVEHEGKREAKWWRRDVPEALVSAAAASRWLRDRAERGALSPFFLFWHTYEPHWPYTDGRFVGAAAPLPPGVAEEAREAWQRYLGDLAVADRALGGLLDTLEELGLRESTDVIVFSDHGEEFGEHSDGDRSRDRRHGHGSWDTLLRVPLVIDSPTIAPGRRDEQVSLVDLFPTLLACAGRPVPDSQGRPLQVPGGHDSVGAEALFPPRLKAEEKTWRTAGGLKYVARLTEPPTEILWDLRADPLEERDLSSKHPEELGALREEALEFFAGAPPEWAVRARRGDAGEAPADLPPAVLESLRSLGYVE